MERKNSVQQQKETIQEFDSLSIELKRISDRMKEFQTKNKKKLEDLHPQFKSSGDNFLHYLALRQFNLKSLQLRLANLGLSSLGRCESNVLHNIQTVRERIADTLHSRGKKSGTKSSQVKATPALSWLDAEKSMHQHSQDLFGPKPSNRHVYIMVTAPSAEEFKEEWVRGILKVGANLIRINTAHDTELDWLAMVNCIRKVETDLGLPCRIFMDLAGPKIRTASATRKKLALGDEFFLVNKIRHKKKDVLCSLPEVLKFVKVGERVLFDDGKIETKVKEAIPGRILLQVIRIPNGKAKLKTEKGINFPETFLKIAEITKKDFADLNFVTAHADLVGLSFVQSAETIRRIRKEIQKNTKRREVGLVLKIETRAGFQALPQLLLEAMKGYPCGVMIARGDLGVELGFERMVEVQEEILWLCEAAHIPVIWATQVLESAAKNGLPSRAEVTDAASAVRAECVMLNKGPFIEVAVRSLDNILKRMEFHTYKKRHLYRELKVAKLN